MATIDEQYGRYCVALDAYIEGLRTRIGRPKIDELREAFAKAHEEFLSEESDKEQNEQPVSD